MAADTAAPVVTRSARTHHARTRPVLEAEAYAPTTVAAHTMRATVERIEAEVEGRPTREAIT